MCDDRRKRKIRLNRLGIQGLTTAAAFNRQWWNPLRHQSAFALFVESISTRDEDIMHVVIGERITAGMEKHGIFNLILPFATKNRNRGLSHIRQSFRSHGARQHARRKLAFLSHHPANRIGKTDPTRPGSSPRCRPPPCRPGSTCWPRKRSPVPCNSGPPWYRSPCLRVGSRTPPTRRVRIRRSQFAATSAIGWPLVCFFYCPTPLL